jgi:hypothetical protein
MQLLDDHSAEALVGGSGRRSGAILQRRKLNLNLNLNLNNMITVVPQVATGVAITVFGGESGVVVGTFANLGFNLG